MNPLLLIALGGGILYFLNKQTEGVDVKKMPAPVADVVTALQQVPGFNALPDAIKSQVVIAASSGNKAQLLAFADEVEKLGSQYKPVADALRRIAATRP